MKKKKFLRSFVLALCDFLDLLSNLIKKSIRVGISTQLKRYRHKGVRNNWKQDFTYTIPPRYCSISSIIGLMLSRRVRGVIKMTDTKMRMTHNSSLMNVFLFLSLLLKRLQMISFDGGAIFIVHLSTCKSCSLWSLTFLILKFSNSSMKQSAQTASLNWINAIPSFACWLIYRYSISNCHINLPQFLS